jgi:hypothetical protein
MIKRKTGIGIKIKAAKTSSIKKVKKRKTNAKGSRKHLYTSKGAHLAVMSELLCLGWNVAIPEVDVGDDIFVVSDKPIDGTDREFFPVQVKYAMGKKRKKARNFSAGFEVPFSQLERSSGTRNDLIYVFVVRFKNRWESFVIIKRMDLYGMHIRKKGHIGSKIKKKDEFVLRLYMAFNPDKPSVNCSRQDMTANLNTWIPPFKEIKNP